MQHFYVDNTPIYQIVLLYAFFLCVLAYGFKLAARVTCAAREIGFHPRLWSPALLSVFLIVGMLLIVFVLSTAKGFSVVHVSDGFMELQPYGLRESVVLPLEDIQDITLKRVGRGRRVCQFIEITDTSHRRHESISCDQHPDETKRLTVIVDALKRIVSERGAVDHAAN